MHKLLLSQYVLSAALLFFVPIALAQKNKDVDFKLRQGSIKGQKVNGVQYTIFRRTATKRVVFSTGKDLLFCDHAIRNENTGGVRAYGKVVIKQNKGSRIKGDSLLYFKRKNWVEIRGNVKVDEKDTQLTTDVLYYNTKTRNAYYTQGGKVEKKDTQLTSRRGYIDNKARQISFKEEVVMDNLKKKQHLTCDTLFYCLDTEIATFPSHAFIRSEEGTLNTQSGEYNTRTGIFNFTGNTSTENEDYILSAKSIRKTENNLTIARDEVKLFNKKDSITIYGQEMQRREQYNYSKIHGRPLMVKPLTEDTLFLIADTLISSDGKEEQASNLLAFHQVAILMHQMRGVCDSLAYHFDDSTIHFYGDPVLWNEKTQITADTLYAQLKDKQIDRLFLKKNCFMIIQDTLGNYNQIKGREVVAIFQNSHITHVYVDGNAQSLYFAIKQEKEHNDTYRTVGMNKSDCGNMVIYFDEKNQPEIIHCINQPDSKFIPPHELSEPDKRLPKFKIREQERPQKADAYERKHGY